VASSAKLYYWGGQKNFGDSLGSWLLAHFSDTVVQLARTAAESEVIVTGSILHHMPDNWQGTVLGAGSLYPDSKFPVRAEYMAVRGPLTAALAHGSCQDVALGDPGLLAGELVGYQERTYELGIVPHWSDDRLTYRIGADKPGTLVIDVAADPWLVVKQIASCKRVVSSSLHGIIVADGLGIPRRVELAGLPRIEAEGGDWKYRDHNAAIGLPFKVGEWQSPVFSRVEDVQHGLWDAFREYGTQLRRQSWAAASESPF